MDPPLQEPTTTPVAEPSPATTTTPPPEAATTTTTTTTTDMASSVSSSPSASPSPQVPSGQPEVDIRPGNPLVRFIIGFFLITASSVANSLGLNLMKLDHMRAESNPGAYSKHEYLRPMWLAGITSYVLSQLVGSTLALQYLRAEFVAPLGSSSLVFNVIFANWLIGTPITNADVRGTGFIVLGVILILVFASINSGLSTSLSLNRLYALWGRPGFLVFLITQILLLCFAWAVIISFSRILANRTSDIDELDFSKAKPHPRVPKFLHPVYYAHLRFTIALNSYLSAVTHRSSDARLAFLVGIGWASIGGTLAGGSLVFAKAVVMIGMGEGNIYFHPTPLLTIVLLAACAVLQMIALNRGLKAFDSTLIVPVFYAGYTLMGFLDSMIFLNQVGAYSWTILFLICVGVGVLLYGVVLLSTKKESSLPTETTAPDNPSNPDDLESGDGLSAAGTGTASDLHPLPARKRSQSTGTQGSIPEEREALFDADAEERFQARGEDGQPRGGVGKWEVGSDSEEDEVEEDKSGDKEEERRPVLEGRTTNARSVASIGKGGRRRSLNGSLGEEDPWKDA